NGFAMDVQRYLADEPVQACPPSVGYRLRKFVRRNKLALTTLSILALAVLLAVGALTHAYVKVTNALADPTEALGQAESAKSQAQDEQAKTAVALGGERQAKGELTRNLYYHRIALAHREWQAADIQRAPHPLTECPAEPRGWGLQYLNRLCNPELLGWQAHGQHVNCLAFSPDGRRLASGSYGTMTIWDASTGQELVRLRGRALIRRSMVWPSARTADGWLPRAEIRMEQ